MGTTILHSGLNSIIYKRDGKQIIKLPRSSKLSLSNLNEIAITCMVSHPAIMPTQSLCLVHQRLGMIQEYVPLKRYPADVNRAILDLAEAVYFLHIAGIVHLDIKPANVLVSAETDRCFLTDFGNAILTQNLTVQTEDAHGTLYYQAPEASNFKYSDKTDVWCLGWTFAEFILQRSISNPHNVARWGLSSFHRMLLEHMLCPVGERWNMAQVCEYLNIRQIRGTVVGIPGKVSSYVDDICKRDKKTTAATAAHVVNAALCRKTTVPPSQLLACHELILRLNGIILNLCCV